MDLEHVAEIIIEPTPPFHFNGTFHKPSHFPTSFRKTQQGTYWQTFRRSDDVLGVRISDATASGAPRITLDLYAAEPLTADVVDAIRDELTWRFDLRADLDEFYAVCGRDPVLEPALRRWRGMRIGTSYSLYEYLTVAIVLQNTTVRRSVQMMHAMFGTFGTKERFDGLELDAFWTPCDVASVEEEALRELKVGYRAKSLSRISRSFCHREIDEIALRDTPRPIAADALLKLYGVGPASVWYIMFDVYHHYDAFDVVSPWECKIYSQLLFGSMDATPQQVLTEVRERWGRWRMLAAHYLFEDLFWQHRQGLAPWLDALIRL